MLSFGGNSVIKHVTRGILYAVIISLILVLVFALALMTMPISDSIAKPIVQTIKVISIFFGVMIAIRHIEQRGWLFGGLVGLLYTVLAFFIFSIIYTDFTITNGLLTDMVFAAIIGVLSALFLKTMRTPVA